MGVILTSSCSSSNPDMQTMAQEDDEIMVDIISSTAEASSEAEVTPTSEAIFVYSAEVDSRSDPFAPEESLSPMTYEGGPKLRGILRSSKPLAIVEILEQGFIVGVGEEVAGYKVHSIEEESILLQRGHKRVKLELEKEGDDSCPMF